MKTVSKVYNIVITCINVLVCVCALSIIGFTTAPRLFGVNSFIVLSGSMEPTIHTGSLAYVNTKEKDLVSNDIATYRLTSGGETVEYVTHRVVGFDSNGDYVFKGDMNEVVDANTIPKTRVVGKYMFSIPKLGFLMDKFSPKFAIIGVIWVIILNVFNYVLEYLAK